MTFDHSAAFNVARRDSEKAEHDLLQESFCDESPMVSERYCSSLLISERNKTAFDTMVPDECKQFSSIQDALKRRDSNRVDAQIAFAGMHAGEAQMAQAARASGHLAPAQIKRRLTNRSKRDETSWFN
mmetsp:Transcript_14318/g.40741  ORF Transcript_14318/g.40741 Transcript_14318/m.40741 type:complete len:128 (-) Transcript_14318:602-985(-)|eukprot:CAMPEP_0119560292 /NCGR_PEP_ID=MMETSP1352-20130426/14499_1 /TAXON_ID=265584 /ORGANISM="Stauroneis constricta, Strain CCMP1120" /LENGTH=127 /DNA_ID=CAMNT_0007608245 /DNA_START=144 /DNA_END=527 /DNA_ORIENTATION=+